MGLTTAQLQQIKQFIQRKGFVYLDVQLEIIDHVATAIEEKMEVNPQLDFNQALVKTHASFGIFGFSTIEDAISNGLSKKYNRFFWRTFLSFFNYKYIVLLFLGAAFTYQVQQLLVGYHWWFAAFIGLTIVSLIILIAVRTYQVKLNQYLSFKLSISYFLATSSLLCFILQFQNQVLLSTTIFGLNTTGACVSLLMVLFVLYLLSAFKTMELGISESTQLQKKYQYLS
ncbi:hypothetical protein [Pedobacter gandavensis]|uniref:Uncharacterized protein n=1 Tax=Pedobacter gandavensis TaxID=2679963 RepID=A0ABR6ES67_9SPHI|nr:hypothetical protein [Pedobacter gandavensis]MBB2147897.1 hypothetical protein [Pedobacter gandavensis]